jgi:iron complex outermembrane recepter protein
MTIITNPVPRSQEPSAAAGGERVRRPYRLDSGSELGSAFVMVTLARLAPLFVCAGVLTSSLPAAAQAQPAPPPAARPEAAPAATPPVSPEAAAPAAPASPEAEPPATPATSPEATPPATPAASPEASPAAAQTSSAAEPQPEEPTESLETGELPEVVVTGFGQSLGAALLRKQRTTAQVDAIVAEDMAAFPDLNLAESLQRLPGISITRSYGEGAQITVRGLSGAYTRVRVNGMESRAAVGNNTGRSFDFNVFASELFNSVVVRKTATADVDEGSLGAVVDLNTARAFNYEDGFTFAAGATAAYNDLSHAVRPRLTGLVAYRDPGGVWGATASAAYSSTRNDSASRDTVRWQKGPFRSVNGVPCSAVVAMETDPGCAAVTDAFHPRIPRSGQEVNTSDRLGLTGGLQFRPTEQTEVRLDGLYANYVTHNDRRWFEMLLRGNEARFDLSNYVIEEFPVRFGVGNNTVIAGTVDNAYVRSERNPIHSRSNYYQVTLGLDHRFTDKFYVDGLAGKTHSKGRHNDYAVNYDIPNYNGYSFDYRNDQYPSLVYGGPDITDPANFLVTELRDRHISTDSGSDNIKLNLHYDLFEELGLVAGVNYKRGSLQTKALDHSGTVCALGVFVCDADGDMVNEALGPPGEPGLTETIHYRGKLGAGSNPRWASAVPSAWFDRLDYASVPLVEDQTAAYKVTESNLGFYLQAKGEFLLGPENMRLLYDTGIRYVQTRQTSSGYNTGTFVDIDRPMYDDWLPSANTALWLNEQFVVRLGAASVMTRPALNTLSPGGTVDGGGYVVSYQNPYLNPTRAITLDTSAEWYFAKNSILSLALFFKDIESFPLRQSHIGTFASTGLPRSIIPPNSPASASENGEGTCGNPEGCWEISQLQDGPGATVKGIEVGLQAPLSAFYGHLPPVIDGLGFVANYTFVDSTVDYAFVGNPVKERLVGLSNHSINATVYYEDSKFRIRLSVAYRSDYLQGGPNANGNLWDYAEPDTRLDLSSSYTVNDHFKLSFEALNLSNTPTDTRTDIDAHRRVLYNNTGRNFLLGARVNY